MLKRIVFIFILSIFQNVLCAKYTWGEDIPPYSGTGPRNIYYITGMKDKLLTYTGPAANQDNWSKPYQELCNFYEQKGYRFFSSLPNSLDGNFRKNVKVIFWHNIPPLSLCLVLGEALLQKVVILLLEPFHIFPDNYNPVMHAYFPKILTWHDLLVDNKKYFKYHLVQSNLTMIKDTVPFDQKKLCTLIASNKNFQHKDSLYPKRRQAIAFFERYAPDQFEFYGFGWNRGAYKTYRGPAKSKTQTFKKYKFSICYENIAHQKGYITEKIFGSFVAGCVPIYWGADNITDYIPANCFIDKRDFPNFKNLYDYMNTMSKEEYNGYIQNIQTFLASQDAHKFSIEHFVYTLTHLAHTM